jgi:beta-galactosidase
MYAPEKAKYPQRLILGTETFHNTPYWLAVRDHDYVIGEFVWVGFDYLGESGRYPKRGWDAGLIDMAGIPNPEYYLRKSYWSDEPVVRIAVETSKSPASDWHPRKTTSHWNHKWVGDYLLPVYVYSNCDEIELRLNDSIIGRKAVDKNLYYARWDLPYKTGKIQAIGYKNNKKTTEHTLSTAGEAVGMNISASKPTLLANKEDIVALEICIVDENGVPVPDATNEISVEITGPAKLIGIDNGNQSDVIAFKTNTRKAFEGRLLITIQATTVNGPVKIKLQSAGLKPAEYSIQTLHLQNPSVITTK